MIKASDLRPGNIVYRHMPQDKEVITVEEVRRSDAHLIRYFVKSFLCPAYENELSGIPLTDEWLRAFGFEGFEDEEDNGNWHMGNFVIWSHIDDKGVFTYDGYPIKHVHQLQNIYHALTGEELEIKQS